MKEMARRWMLFVFAMVTLMYTGGAIWAAEDRLEFDFLPPSEWYHAFNLGDVSVAGGILTITAPNYNEFVLYDPNGAWHQTVDNERGWQIEARVSLEPGAVTACQTCGVGFWIHDHTSLIIVNLRPGGIQLSYPYSEFEFAATDTAEFHVYRIEGKGSIVKIYQDDVLLINRDLGSVVGGGTVALCFGDLGGGGFTRSHWDYFGYNTDGVSGPGSMNTLLIESGIPGKGLLSAPGLRKEPNPRSRASDHAGKK